MLYDKMNRTDTDIKLFLTGNYWNPLDANKTEEALPGFPQK